MINGYENKIYTEKGDLNLIGAIVKYSKEAALPLAREIYKKDIFPYIDKDIPASSYAGVNIARLGRLFSDIKRRGIISNADFDETCRDLISGPLEKYFEEELGISDALWGAWYKADDIEEDMYILHKSSFSDKEQSILESALTRQAAPPEATAFALNVFAGLTIEEAMSARIRDLSIDRDGYLTLHTMGSFPKLSRVNDSDTRPRFVTIDGTLADVLVARRKDASDPDAFIAEKHGNYCHIQELHFFARDLLRTVLDIDEVMLSLTERDMLVNTFIYKRERSSAYMLGRRTFANRLYGEGKEPDEINYLLGLNPEETTDEEGNESDF